VGHSKASLPPRLLIFVNADEVYDEVNKAQCEFYPVPQAYSHHKRMAGRDGWMRNGFLRELGGKDKQ